MNVLKAMDRYWKELIQVSSSKNDIKVLYLYNSAMNLLIATYNITATYNTSYESLVACGRCPTTIFTIYIADLACWVKD